MPNATIRDVAREAAVSVASVSRVMNGLDNVRPALRDRVEAAAAALGYVPHAGARNLSLARANAIGIVLPDIHGEFFSEFLRGMDREASRRGLQLLLSNMHADAERAVGALQTMRGRVDGLVVMAPHVDPDLLFAQLPPGLPVVLVNCAPHHEQRPEIRVDNAQAAAAMIDHLVAGGRRRIVHLSGPQGNIDAAERADGYRAAMTRHGLTPRIIAGDFMEESGAVAAAVLLRETEPTDALFAANDMMAIGALMALRRAGVLVPDDVAVAGFDDIPLARLVSPALTTMRTDIANIGARAIARLVRAIAGDAEHAVELSVPELMQRETTAPKRSTTSPAIGPIRGMTS
ncbi:LacI family DNA-binding transcriptional regulator [Sphingomonas sp.]|jgi:LacI family transcriptional regulator|uniref:LacI family DNA-binding transcriptional regulator n=1 Tax=Sphingomonas sp. TaxID=28214 RepID=UPI002EDA24D7